MISSWYKNMPPTQNLLSFLKDTKSLTMTVAVVNFLTSMVIWNAVNSDGKAANISFIPVMLSSLLFCVTVSLALGQERPSWLRSDVVAAPIKLFLSQGQTDKHENEKDEEVRPTPAPRFSTFSSASDDFCWKPLVLPKIEDGKKGLHMKRTYTTEEVDVNPDEIDEQVHAPLTQIGRQSAPPALTASERSGNTFHSLPYKDDQSSHRSQASQRPALMHTSAPPSGAHGSTGEIENKGKIPNGVPPETMYREGTVPPQNGNATELSPPVTRKSQTNMGVLPSRRTTPLCTECSLSMKKTIESSLSRNNT